MENTEYCQMIIKSEPDEIDPLKSCLSSFELQVKTEVEDDVCNQSEIQDMKDDSKQDNSNISCDESIANVGKKVTTTKVKEIEKGRLKNIVTNIARKTKNSRISKENLKRPCSVRERSEMIVKSFLSGDNGSLTPMRYKGVVLLKEASHRCYDFKCEDLDKFKREIDNVVSYCCDDCDYTTNHFAMFKVHFMTHANMKFLIECMNTCTKLYCCYLCDFKCYDSEELDRHINVHRNKSMIRVNEKSMNDSELVQPTVDSSTVPLDDASIKTESISDGNKNTQNTNAVNCVVKLKQSEKYSTSRKRGVVKTNNGVNKSKKSIVKVRERHVDESEIQPNVPENSGDSIDEKIFKIEFISAADDSEYLHNKNTSSGNIIKDRRQASIRLKTCSKRNSVEEVINDSKKSEKESSDEEDDYKDYNDSIFGDGSDCHDVEEDTVDHSAPQDAMLSCHIKVEYDPDIPAAVSVKDEVCHEGTNHNQKILLNKSDKRLTCNSCNFVAKIPLQLKRHSCKESFICDMCGKICPSGSALKRHVNSHHGNVIIHLSDKRFECSMCNAVRRRISCMKKHIHLKHCTPDKKICGLDNCIKGHSVEFICNDCSQKFTSKSTLKDHIERKHSVGRIYGCSLCEEKFRVQLYKRRHEKRHFCSTCPFQSISIEETFKHVKTHTDKKKLAFRCELCKYETTNNEHFQWHVLKHKNSKPYACSQCDFRTKQKGNLLAHEKSHISVMTYSCTLCTFQTNRHRTFLKHKETHGLEGEVSMIEDISTRDPRISYCDRCEYKTKHPQFLKTHKMKHDNIRPYLCPVCGATFSSSLELIVHKNGAHLKKNNYKCSYCDYTYHMKQTVVIHERKHTGEKPHRCDLCAYSTSYMGNLSAHKKKHKAALTVS